MPCFSPTPLPPNIPGVYQLTTSDITLPVVLVHKDFGVCNIIVNELSCKSSCKYAGASTYSG